MNKGIMNESIVMRHFASRLNTRVKVTFKDDLQIEGILASIDYPRMWVEVNGLRKTYFVNMHKIAFVETIPTEEAVNLAEKRRNGDF